MLVLSLTTLGSTRAATSSTKPAETPGDPGASSALSGALTDRESCKCSPTAAPITPATAATTSAPITRPPARDRFRRLRGCGLALSVPAEASLAWPCESGGPVDMMLGSLGGVPWKGWRRRLPRIGGRNTNRLRASSHCSSSLIPKCVSRPPARICPPDRSFRSSVAHSSAFRREFRRREPVMSVDR